MPNEQLDRIEVKLAEVEALAEAALASSEKVRKYMLWTAVVTIVAIVLPLLVLPLLVPAFLSSVALPSGF